MKTIKITEKSQIKSEIMNKDCVMVLIKLTKPKVEIYKGRLEYHQFYQGVVEKEIAFKQTLHGEYTVVVSHPLYTNREDYHYLIIFPEANESLDDCIESARVMKVGMEL